MSIFFNEIIIPRKPFIDQRGRAMRFVWEGVTRLRLQDNRGRNYITSYKGLIKNFIK